MEGGYIHVCIYVDLYRKLRYVLVVGVGTYLGSATRTKIRLFRRTSTLPILVRDETTYLPT